MFKSKFIDAFQNQIKQKLSIQTMILTFVIVIVLSIISSYIQINHENLNNKRDFDIHILEIELLAKTSLVEAIVNHNQKGIKEFFNQLKNCSFITFAELSKNEANNSIDIPDFKYGNRINDTSQKTTVKNIPLESGNKIIGNLAIAFNQNYLVDNLRIKLPLVILINLFLAIVISICVMLLIHSIIIKHILYLVQKTSNSSIQNINEILSLPNRDKDMFKNELDDLVNSINDMRQMLFNEIRNNRFTNQELKRQRDFSTTLLNSCNLIICKLDPEYKIVDVNSSTSLMTGFLDFEINGKQWLEVFVTSNKRQEIKSKLKKSVFCNIKELATQDQNGNTLYLEWYIVPFYEENNLKYHIAFGYDITKLKDIQTKLENVNSELEEKIEKRTRKLQEANNDLKRAYDELQSAQKQLITSETLASLGSLVAGISHEINTPLGVSVTAQSIITEQLQKLNSIYNRIKNGATVNSLTLKQPLAIMAEANEILESNLKQASKLIKSFKQVAVDSSSQSMYQFNVRENLNQTLLSLSNIIRKEKLTVNVICNSEYAIYSYPGALTQIYTNLIINSARHAYTEVPADSQIQKLITIAVTKLPNDRFQIIYQDNGGGISAEILPRIFEPFITTQRGKGGSGLGANIIYNLVNKVLLGKISCENLTAPTHGAKFTIIIPNLKDNKEESHDA